MEYSPTVLVLGPGGFKGFVYLGSILRLRECGLLDKINHFVGVSIGAIISSLLVSGVTIEKIIVEGIGVDLISSFIDKDVKVGDVITHLGLIDHSLMREKLGKIFIECFRTIPTLDELFRLTNKKLTVVTSNISRREVQYINYENSPHLSVVDAVMMSSNIPLIFQCLEINGDFFADGAIGNPFPLDYVDDGHTQILGVIVKSIFNDKIDVHKLSGIVQYLFRSFNFSIEELERTKLKSLSSQCRTLILKSSSIDTMGVFLDKDRKLMMIVEGYFQTSSLLESWGRIVPSKSAEDLKKVFTP